jgi:myo-inositol 2-dehydrogenase/D-chiro-inositol 1-dehydrogenase
MNVIQVGTGKMGQRWLEALVASPDVDLVGVVEPVDALREAAIARTGLDPASAFPSIEAALAGGTAFDAAVIVTPPPSHRPLAEQFLRAGRHVLLEKPLATTMDDARALVDCAAETGRTLMVAQNYRHHRGFPELRNAIRDGQIGAVSAVNIRFEKDTRTLFGEGDFRYSMQHVLLVDMSIHHFDLIRAALGTNPQRLYAQTWHVPEGNYQYDAAASVLMTMDSGTRVSYTGNWASFGPETSWNADWEFVGEDGRIVWTDAGVTLQRWGEESADLPVAEPGDAQGALVHEFVTAITAGTPPPSHAGDNINSLAIVFAAIESSLTGEVIAFS